MNRKLKTLGLALVAALVLTAVMASTASAQFTSSKLHTTLAGSQKAGTNHVFSVGMGFGSITCTNVTYSGTLGAMSNETMVLFPTYNNCKDGFGRTVDGTFSSPAYTFTSGVGANGGTKGDVDFSGEIVWEITSGGIVVCTVTIKAQTNNGVTYKNLGGVSGIEIITHATNIQTTTVGGFFNCGVSNGGHGNGTTDGSSIITGKGGDGLAAELQIH